MFRAIGIFLLFLIVVGMIIDKTGSHSSTPNPALSQEWDDVMEAKPYVRVIKEAMRNPDSFQVKSIYMMKQRAICLEFRSQNGFGGMTPGLAVVTPDRTQIKTEEMSGFDKLWDKYCAHMRGKSLLPYF